MIVVKLAAKGVSERSEEEPFAAGAEPRSGIRRAVEPASGRAARRCAAGADPAERAERRSEAGDDDGFAGEVVVGAAVKAAEDLDLREAGAG
jgi:hypothetical protein